MASVELLLPVAAAILLVTALGITGFDIDEAAPTARAGRPGAPRTGARRAGIQTLRDHPFLVRLGLLTAVATVDGADDRLHVQEGRGRDLSPPKSSASFFAKYYAALNGVALLVQVVRSRRAREARRHDRRRT
jgi:hypothetical protein